MKPQLELEKVLSECEEQVDDRTEKALRKYARQIRREIKERKFKEISERNNE